MLFLPLFQLSLGTSSNVRLGAKGAQIVDKSYTSGSPIVKKLEFREYVGSVTAAASVIFTQEI